MKTNLFRLIALLLVLVSNATVNAESVSVTLTREGSLAEKVLEQATSLSTVKELTVSGKINEADWNCISLQMTNLQHLDMKNAISSFEDVSCFNSTVETAILPEGIKNIKCGRIDSKIKHLTLPNSLTYICGDAFQYSSIESITFGNGLTQVDHIAFNSCDNLQIVNIPNIESWCKIKWRYDSNPCCNNINWNNNIHVYVYVDGGKITHLNIPDNVSVINDYAFEGWPIESIEIPSSVSSIGAYSFHGAQSLKSCEF